jgi:hypothetical protein
MTMFRLTTKIPLINYQFLIMDCLRDILDNTFSHLHHSDHHLVDQQNFLDRRNISDIVSFHMDCGKWPSQAQIDQKDVVDQPKVDKYRVSNKSLASNSRNRITRNQIGQILLGVIMVFLMRQTAETSASATVNPASRSLMRPNK